MTSLSLPSYLQQQASLYRLNKARSLTSGQQLLLPTPYGLQQDIINHPAKRKVVCAGRRAGKTVLAAYMAVSALLKAQRVLLSSTSQDQADVFWEYITDWLAPLINNGLYKNEVKRIVKYAGGQIHVKTGRHPDALRGGKADLLVLDECAYLDADAWGKVGAPMLADTTGTAVFISTPNRRNWFFELYQKAIADDTGQWAAWNFSTDQNIYLPKASFDALVSDMTEEDYQQEILAQFLEGEGAVFRHVDERCTGQKKPPYPGLFCFGVDFAQVKDYTVIVVIDSDTGEVVDMERFNQMDWSLQRQKIFDLNERWHPQAIIAEQNSVGSPNIEALQSEGLNVVAFETTGTTKPPLIESLILAFDRGEITHLDDPKVKGEFMAYERKVSPTGRSQYSAPEGLHDDIVMATALAWYGSIMYGVTIGAIAESAYNPMEGSA